eukprot:Amastigsp_a522188_5.p3 type:complete len:133 gc:universal Amastigsp_a522188_5:736-338(-)
MSVPTTTSRKPTPRKSAARTHRAPSSANPEENTNAAPKTPPPRPGKHITCWEIQPAAMTSTMPSLVRSARSMPMAPPTSPLPTIRLESKVPRPSTFGAHHTAPAVSSGPVVTPVPYVPQTTSRSPSSSTSKA